ncbi:MAG: aminopeptidase N [Planctomycetota bacterium]|nr:MAG: aminopeptidase N [Planctomycetota bacterium]
MSHLQPIRRQDYRPPVFTIHSVDMDVDIFDSHCRVRCRLDIERHEGTTDPLLLDGEDLDCRALLLDGEELSKDRYEIADQRLCIPNFPHRGVLESEVILTPRENRQLSGMYQSGSTICTQCEAEGFRRITWYLDRPDVLSRFRVRISADRQQFPVLLSNGNRIAENQLDDGRYCVEWHDPHPKPSYLFALVAGPLECLPGSFTTMSGRQVRLEMWVEPGYREQCHHALESLQHAMRWDEEQYGREYDLDIYMIVAVSDFNMGAMENKGLNVFNTKYVLADDDTATDGDFEGVEGVIAHEYFHNWTGNRITCRDWFQLTLKEGLTVFRDQQFSADRTSHAIKRIEEVRLLRGHQFPEDAGPMAHPIRPEQYVAMDNFYTATVYNKGAEVIRMYHTLLGAQGFRNGMDLYFQRHDGQAVTCDDFRAAMADANQRDLSQFERWYDQAGTPDVFVEEHFDADQGCLHLSLRQDRRAIPDSPPAQPYHIPVRLGLLDRQGTSLPVMLTPDAGDAAPEVVLELVNQQQQWTLHGLHERPVLSILRDFSAPVRLHHQCDEDDLLILAAHDTDPFNRWQAMQDISRRCLLEQVAAITTPVRDKPAFQALSTAFAAILQSDSADDALKALALTLPGEQELAQELTPVPVEALHAARRAVIYALAEEHTALLHDTYTSRDGIDGKDRSVAARQQRRLRHCCLTYLSALGERYGDLVADHYQQAGNMTERMAALGALVSSHNERREACLDDFYQRFEQQPLVVDKWFMLQAISEREDCLDEVARLQQHPDFTLDNPNRARSLLSAFAMANHAQFHRSDGAGYQLIGDAVRALSRRNPQIAARLCSAFNQWRRYDEDRQNAMRQQLEAIQADNPSRDVAEIVERALAAPAVQTTPS